MKHATVFFALCLAAAIAITCGTACATAPPLVARSSPAAVTLDPCHPPSAPEMCSGVVGAVADMCHRCGTCTSGEAFNAIEGPGATCSCNDAIDYDLAAADACENDLHGCYTPASLPASCLSVITWSSPPAFPPPCTPDG